MTNKELNELKEFVENTQPFGTGGVVLKNTILNKILKLEQKEIKKE